MAPGIPADMKLWKTGTLIMIAVSLFFPLTGAVLLTVIALDYLIVRRLRPLKRALS